MISKQFQSIKKLNSMKTLIRIIIVLMVFVFFAGCQKEVACDAVQGDWELVN